jgi:hypothetical protein
MAEAKKKDTPKLRKRGKAVDNPETLPFDPPRLLFKLAQATEALTNYLAEPWEQLVKALTESKLLAVARPRGRPRKFDHGDIIAVAEEVIERGPDDTLDLFADRVGGTLEAKGKPVPGDTVLKEICRPIYLRAKGGITD